MNTLPEELIKHTMEFIPQINQAPVKKNYESKDQIQNDYQF